jgi:predicted NBD/HSP70 family sugar kinase
MSEFFLLRTRSLLVNPFETGLRSAPFVLDAAKFRTVETLRYHGKQSRTGIADLILYSPSKMTSVVNDLIDEGILEEVGEGMSTGGRKARAIDFNPTFGYFVAAIVAPLQLDIALVDFSTNIRVRRIIPLPAECSPQGVLSDVAAFLLERLDKLNIPLEKILGFGLATPASVDALSGTFFDTPRLPGWGAYQVDSYLREVFPYAVIVLEKDVNAMAYGELRRGGLPHKTFIALKTTEPASLGIVIDGSIYRGATGRAGEMSDDGCDNTDIEVDLAAVIRLFDPEAIILAGDGSDMEAQNIATISRQILTALSSANTTRRVERSSLGVEATMTGLIIRVAENVFTLEAR